MKREVKFTKEGLPVIPESRLYATIQRMVNKDDEGISVDKIMGKMRYFNSNLHEFLENVSSSDYPNVRMAGAQAKFLICALYESMLKLVKPKDLPKLSKKTLNDTMIEITNGIGTNVYEIMSDLREDIPDFYDCIQRKLYSRNNRMSKREREYTKLIIANFYESMRKEGRKRRE